MKIFLIFCFSLIIFCSVLIHKVNAQIFPPGGWNVLRQNTGDTLFAIDFIDQNTGWTAGKNGVVLKTTNSGISWQYQTLPMEDYYELKFITEEVGYLSGSNGTILKTTNSGDNWSALNTFTSEDLKNFSFPDTQNGYVCGKNNLLLKTTNGGINWNRIFINDSVDLTTVYFIDSNTGWIGTRYKYSNPNVELVKLLKTSNGGMSWVVQHSTLDVDNALHSMQFIDSNTGWCILEHNIIYASSVLKTTNSGQTWNTHSLGNAKWMGLTFKIENKGWAIGDRNRNRYSTDGGLTWIQNTFKNAGPDYHDIDFLDTLNGWICGAGIILKTTNGGVLTDIEFNEGLSIPETAELSQNFPNPFNPVTIINYSITLPGNVSIKIYDMNGKEVGTVINSFKEAGNHAIQISADGLSSGVYFYRLTSGKIVQTRKMMILK